MDVTVVLPCLDEEKSVGLCVAEAQAAFGSAGLVGEVLVVDNGSTDSTLSVASAAGARVICESRRGYGNALRAGIEGAWGEVVVMADADFTYDLSLIPQLVAPVMSGKADMTVAARLRGATRRTMPFLHRFVGTPILTMLVRRVAGGDLGISDSQSGYRAFHRRRVGELGLRSTGMEFASELLIKAARRGWRIEEIQGSYRERIGRSKLNTFQDGLRHLGLIIQLAPDLILLGPGALLAFFGLLASLWTLVQPAGVPLGSLRWQPVFFSSICLLLGVQALIAGGLLAHTSAVASTSSGSWLQIVRSPRFPLISQRIGVGSIVAGLLIDLAMLVRWVSGAPAPSNGTAVAGVAQSLLLVGGTLLLFGFVARLIFLQRRQYDGISSLWREPARPEPAIETLRNSA